MAESTWRRAWKDTEHFRQSGLFFWLWEVLGAALFAAVGALLLPEEPSRLEYALYPSLGVVAGFATAFLAVFSWNLFRAPYRQRNEARKLDQQYLDQIKRINQEYANKITQMGKKLVDSILQEKHREHLDKIRDLILKWMGGLSVPRISEVMPGTIPSTEAVKNDVRFVYLKEHLPFKELWQNFDDWDSNIQEYLDRCKALRDEIRESWKIDGTHATPSFDNPILKMIDGEKLDFKLLYDKEHTLKEVTNQMLIVNGTEVVRGSLWPYVKTWEELGHYRCLYETLGMEYQKLANEFLNQPLIAELRQLSSSLITISSDIQESLWQVLEKADYINHTCRNCPVRQELTEPHL